MRWPRWVPCERPERQPLATGPSFHKHPRRGPRTRGWSSSQRTRPELSRDTQGSVAAPGRRSATHARHPHPSPAPCLRDRRHAFEAARPAVSRGTAEPTVSTPANLRRAHANLRRLTCSERRERPQTTLRSHVERASVVPPTWLPDFASSAREACRWGFLDCSRPGARPLAGPPASSRCGCADPIVSVTPSVEAPRW